MSQRVEDSLLAGFAADARVALGSVGVEEPVRSGPVSAGGWMVPELADLATRVRQAFGRVHVCGILQSDAELLFGSAGLPCVLFWFRLAVDSVQLEEHFRGYCVSGDGRSARAFGQKELAELAEMLLPRPRESRFSRASVNSWVARASILASDEAERLAQEARREVLTLQSRRAREVEAVFDVRVREVDQSEGDQAHVRMQELMQERRRALEHVAEHFDPDRLEVRIEPELLLVLCRGGRRKVVEPKVGDGGQIEGGVVEVEKPSPTEPA